MTNRNCFSVPWIAVWLLSAYFAFAQSPLSVSSARASQRAGTKLVDVYYDVSGGAAPYTVSLDGSLDGGATWTLPVTSVSGNVGNLAAAGTNLKVTWDAGMDWPGQLSENVRFRVNVADSEVLDGFVLVPSGSFRMGDSFSEGESNERPVHTVNVSAFFMAKHETTHGQWLDVGDWANANGYNIAGFGEEGESHPVHNVNWYDVVKWCNARSQMDGLTPCYTVGGSVFKTGVDSAVSCNFGANGYRLPTEAEWEKAARGGLRGKRYSWGDTISHSRANYYARGASYGYGEQSDGGFHPTYNDGTFAKSSPVGSFASNGYGLYDMAGNMWEWCWDWYGDSYYSLSTSSDPRGPSSGTYRVGRGGSWSSSTYGCRAAARAAIEPRILDNDIGFRVARSLVLK